MGITSAVSNAGSNRFISFAIFTPRLWKIMIAGAYPFLLLATDYFENLERTGRTGAYVADTLLPVTLIGYVALIVALKKRAI